MTVCRLGLYPCYNKVCDCDGPRVPPGARKSTCPECGYTYGTHADTCLAFIHGMLTRLHPLTYGKVGRLYMVKPKCDGDHGGPACPDPECWQRPAPPDPNHDRAMALAVDILKPCVSRIPYGLDIETVPTPLPAWLRFFSVDDTQGTVPMTENKTPPETDDIVERRTENVEHVSRVREFRRLLESKHAEAQSHLDTATWELGDRQRKVQELTRRRDFITSEIEAFDKRHKDVVDP